MSQETLVLQTLNALETLADQVESVLLALQTPKDTLAHVIVVSISREIHALQTLNALEIPVETWAFVA